MQSETTLKSNITKTLVKGTIGIAVFSLFLEVNPSNFVNYLVFLCISYLALAVYMLLKKSTIYTMDNAGIRIRRPFRRDIGVPYNNIHGLSYAQGMLARRFGCGTVYIELERGKGTHKALGGGAVVALRDVPRPVEVYGEISNMLGPFTPSV